MLITICLSLVKCLLIFFAHFWMCVVCHYYYGVVRVVYIFWIRLLYQIRVLHIHVFFWSFACLFIFMLPFYFVWFGFLFVCFCLFFFWPLCVACGILFPEPGIEPAPPAVTVWSLNHWTAREVPSFYFYLFIFIFKWLFLKCSSFNFDEVQFIMLSGIEIFAQLKVLKIFSYVLF